MKGSASLYMYTWRSIYPDLRPLHSCRAVFSFSNILANDRETALFCISLFFLSIAIESADDVKCQLLLT